MGRKLLKILTLHILLFCFLVVIFMSYGCSASKTSSSDETTVSQVTEPGSGETSGAAASEATASETNSASTTVETSIAETTAETSSGDEDYISYKNNYLGGNPGTLLMQINLKTGDVKGYILTSFKEISLEGNSSEVCEFTFKANLSGTIDLKTFVIKGVMSGSLSAPNETCYNGNTAFNFSANLSSDESSVKGEFITLLGSTYQFFLKKM
ncbi:MAG: hypothetical protein M1409_10445 [Actinobacteria bacterium]|nr:hypothetical protein [Actinomycetota bacterium]